MSFWENLNIGGVFAVFGNLKKRVTMEFARKMIGSTVRHAITAFGVWLAANGIISSEQVQQAAPLLNEIVVGTIITLGGLALSFIEKWRKS